MLFSSLHRHLGMPAGPITEAMLDEAITRGVAEATDLDWKSELPRRSALANSDFPKDVAAMANAGGGTLVYGIKDVEKRASSRTDAGQLDENFERSLRAVANTAIFPPVLGLVIETVVTNGPHAHVVIVPDSRDTPHIIYKNQLFGAPLRNDSDTAWMTERQLEAAYRARFSTASDASKALQALYDEATRAQNPHRAAQFIAVARPRLPHAQGRLSRLPVAKLIDEANLFSATLLDDQLRKALNQSVNRPLRAVLASRPRRGFRRWTALSMWGEKRLVDTHAAVHDDGSISLGTMGGGLWSAEMRTNRGGHAVTTPDLEAFIGDFFALVRSVGGALSGSEYDYMVGLEWAGTDGVVCFDIGPGQREHATEGLFAGSFQAVRGTISTLVDDADFIADIRSVALDCVSQFGVTELRTLPDRLST